MSNSREIVFTPEKFILRNYLQIRIPGTMIGMREIPTAQEDGEKSVIMELEVASEEIVKIVEAIAEVTEATIEVHVIISEVTIEEDIVMILEENHEEVTEVNDLVEAVLEATILRRRPVTIVEETSISILVIAIFVQNEVLRIVVEVAALEANTIIMKIAEETEIFANLMMIETLAGVRTVKTSLVISIIEARVEVHTVRSNLVILTIFVEQEVADVEVVEAIEELDMTEDRKEVIPVGGTIAEENPEVTRHREISTIGLVDVVDLLEVAEGRPYIEVEVGLHHTEVVLGEATLAMIMILRGHVIVVVHLLMTVIKGNFFFH